MVFGVDGDLQYAVATYAFFGVAGTVVVVISDLFGVVKVFLLLADDIFLRML